VRAEWRAVAGCLKLVQQMPGAQGSSRSSGNVTVNVSENQAKQRILMLARLMIALVRLYQRLFRR